MSDDNSKMHYFQNEKPEPFMGLSNISFVTRGEFEEFKQKMLGFYKYVDRDASDISVLSTRTAALEVHKNYQIEENRKISRRVDALSLVSYDDQIEELNERIKGLESKLIVQHKEGQMTFINAWLAMTQGGRVKRIEWEELHAYMIHGKIKFDGYSQEENVLSSEDINACDWVTLR